MSRASVMDFIKSIYLQEAPPLATQLTITSHTLQIMSLPSPPQLVRTRPSIALLDKEMIRALLMPNMERNLQLISFGPSPAASSKPLRWRAIYRKSKEVLRFGEISDES